MVGELDVDAVLESMSPADLAAWQAWDRVDPMRHSSRMLGLIAIFLAQFLGIDVDEGESGGTLRAVCLPWLEHKVTFDAAINQLKGVPRGNAG